MTQGQMATDNQHVPNFRANYYHKLGSTAAMEEKKNLTKLLGSTPLDIKKLEQFCQHLHIPSDYRIEVWKVLLNITPIYRSTLEYVVNQRREHYERLAELVDVMKLVSEHNAHHSDLVCKWTAMYSVEFRLLPLINFDGAAVENETVQTFRSVAGGVERLDFTPIDSYWVARNMTKLVEEKVHPHIASLVETTWQLVQKEESAVAVHSSSASAANQSSSRLISHLKNTGAYDAMPIQLWLSSCFADTLPDSTFDRLWDKVISGSCIVLAHAAAALILINRRPILIMKTSKEIIDFFTQIQPDTADEVVRKAIDSWYRQGGKLTPSSTRASPLLPSSLYTADGSSSRSSTPPVTAAVAHTPPPYLSLPTTASIR